MTATPQKFRVVIWATMPDGHERLLTTVRHEDDSRPNMDNLKEYWNEHKTAGGKADGFLAFLQAKGYLKARGQQFWDRLLLHVNVGATQ